MGCAAAIEFASMGPRFDERGKPTFDRRFAGEIFASMGPRFDERGKLNHTNEAARRVARFNGVSKLR